MIVSHCGRIYQAVIPQFLGGGQNFAGLRSLGNHRLTCGDSADIADFDKLLNGNKIQFVNTDPPFRKKHGLVLFSLAEKFFSGKMQDIEKSANQLSSFILLKSKMPLPHTCTIKQLRSDVLAVWNAAVDGVRIDRIMQEYVSVSKNEETLTIGRIDYPVADFQRIVIVGAGKASGAMAKMLEEILQPVAGKIPITGWVNVPADCVVPLQHITLHPARPAGVNEPTEEAFRGTQEIIRQLQSLSDRDICINLLSGGGSALLTAPEDGITLQDKLELTRFLSESGASINELNAVRKQVSKIKGGAMKELCRGKQLISLILSDVIGDPLDVIASGPTVSNTVSAEEALTILREFIAKNQSVISPVRKEVLFRIMGVLERKQQYGMFKRPVLEEETDVYYDSDGGFVQNIIIGNNAVAVMEASDKGYDLDYSPSMYIESAANRTAEETGIELAKIVIGLQDGIASEIESDIPHTDMLVHGGEPVVHLVPAASRGKGGRNQQLVLAALDYLLKHYDELKPNVGIMFLSGGTDGEDGPTDAAGAYFDSELLEKLHRLQTEMPDNIVEPFLKRNDAYHFFAKYGTLLKTGITGTNVCDVRVAAVCRLPSRFSVILQ